MKQIGTPEPEMSFLDHLEDLRWHLIKAVIAIVVAGSIAFFLKGFIFDVLLFGPSRGDFFSYDILCRISTSLGMDAGFCFDEMPFRIQSRTMGGQFSAHVWTSITAGFIIAFPYVIYQFWQFVAPAMHDNERKHAKGFIFITSLLFFIGVIFGYYVVTPLSINFLGKYQVSEAVFNDFDLGSYIGLVRASVLASGLIFELPIVIYFLTRVGVVTPQFLKKYRKYALVIVLILSAIITPPDIVSQIIVAIPVLILYEVSIIISKVIYKQEQRKINKR
ncbi:twin-arginine translocase subunit TatC [Salegentibacter salegens]|uniref:Sec-independent protein translocase protein TatC n=1 Tax=Salegentibacter salegens TaxID=143223 RepID=A0A1M7NFG3_9FLAO|nr:twin-arginine translocase subunit TatC [Salegentibacter salegens]PRX46277.1 sec-independent protein translocase protein TatC [Salegentibacter salegens]SHN02428.1 Sec-independent protein translocase TatC [Salegentibacter salegens]